MFGFLFQTYTEAFWWPLNILWQGEQPRAQRRVTVPYLPSWAQVGWGRGAETPAALLQLVIGCVLLPRPPPRALSRSRWKWWSLQPWWHLKGKIQENRDMVKNTLKDTDQCLWQVQVDHSTRHSWQCWCWPALDPSERTGKQTGNDSNNVPMNLFVMWKHNAKQCLSSSRAPILLLAGTLSNYSRLIKWHHPLYRTHPGYLPCPWSEPVQRCSL